MLTNDELEEVRSNLCKMISSNMYSLEELLKVSQELDALVVKLMKEKLIY